MTSNRTKKTTKKTKESGTKRLRNCNEQSKYRKKSKANAKYKKHVAHRLDLEVAVEISKRAKGPESTSKLKKILNHPDNFRMVNKETNLIEHKRIARAIIDKAASGHVLTKKEESRVKKQVKFLEQNKKLLPQGFINGAAKLYKSLETKSGKTLFDKRKFK